MIILEHTNRIIEEYISQRLQNPDQRTVDDITCADFDGVLYHVSTPDKDSLSTVTVSLQWGCFSTLAEHGAMESLRRVYGSMLCNEPEDGYDVTLLVNFEALPEGAEPAKLAQKIANLKRHAVAAPFQKTFQEVLKKSASGATIVLPYRDGEAMYIVSNGDRCTVVYEMCFNDSNDSVISKVFLSEMVAQSKKMGGVPSILYVRGEVPLALEHCSDQLIDPENNSFVSIMLFEGHIRQANAFKSVNLLHTFRDYLHYHMKCSKAYLHNRMRACVAKWLLVLNRARPEPFQEKKMKTKSGKTFVRR